MARAKPIAVSAALAAALAAALLVGLWRRSGEPASGPELRRPSDAGTAPRERPALPPPRRGKGEHTIVGAVEDGSQTPIAGVAVLAQREDEPGPRADAAVGYDSEPEMVAVTDGGGQFRLEGAMPGHYRLRIEGEGVFTSEVRFVAVPGPEITLVGLRRARLDGRVQRAGQPVTGGDVVLMAEDGGQLRSTVSTDGGFFSLTDLPEGRYRVAAFSGADAAPTVLVDLSGPNPAAAVELALVPGQVVEGRVVDDEGKGIAALVTMTSELGEVPRRSRSDDSGQFRLAGVRAGTWTARAEAKGFLSAAEVAFVVGGGYRPLLRLSRGGVFKGQVTASGTPVAGAEIAVVGVDLSGRRRVFGGLPTAVNGPAFLDADPRFVPSGELGILRGPIPLPPPPGARSLLVTTAVEAETRDGEGPAEIAVTGADGAFTLSGIEPGRYRVVARHPAHADGRSAELSVALGQEREVHIAMVAGTFVTGLVASAGSPVAGARVRLFTDDGDVPRWVAVTGDDGRFRLGPETGAVRLEAEAAGYGQGFAEALLKSGTDAEVTVVLAAADATVRGRVRDGAGFPVAGARLETVGMPRRIDVSGQHGEFSLSGLVAGSHVVRVTRDGYPAATVDLDTGIDNAVTLELGGGIEVVVLDAHTGRPVSGAAVKVSGATSAEERRTDERGAAVFTALAPGPHRIAIEHRDYVPARASTAVPRASTVGAVSVEDFRVTLERGATVAGTVRDRNGARVGGAEVRIGEARAVSDVDGRFRIERAPSGQVAVVATVDDLSGRLPLTLAPGDEVVTLEVVVE